MRIKLWEVRLQCQNPRYWGEHETVVVNAPNAKCAIDRALKKAKSPFVKTIPSVENVELLGVES